MIAGLTSAELDFLERELVRPLREAGFSVWCFGSRARGNQRRFSDVDLLVTGAGDPGRIIGAVQERLVESSFPYMVDLVFEEDLAESYRDRVMRERVPVESALVRG